MAAVEVGSEEVKDEEDSFGRKMAVQHSQMTFDDDSKDWGFGLHRRVMRQQMTTSH